MPRSAVISWAALASLAFVAAALAYTTGIRAAPRTSVVGVTERDFRIMLSTHRVAAGTVLFRVANRGPDAHELIVVRDAHALPLRTDGITVDEEALTKRIVGALEPGDAGDSRELRLHLTPGRYELLCNMAGHFMGGMHAVVVAR